MDLTNTAHTPELKAEYKQEQRENLWKISRIVAPITIVIIVFLLIFSDQVNFPDLYNRMFLGRMYALVLAIIVGISTFTAKTKPYGHILAFMLFLGPSLMAAHLSGVMNNDSSVLPYWIFISIIGCGILPISIPHTVSVVFTSFIYYLVIYFSSGFGPDVAFRMTLINVGSASIVAIAFKATQSRVREREFFFRKSLEEANVEIANLYEQLKDENLRLTTELEVAKHIQTIVLPQKEEYSNFPDLDISCIMIPANEVGGDYYDTIAFEETGIITIGDVTDHGLHSGLIMLMVHTAIRALSQLERDNITRVFEIINKLLYDFRLKTSDHRIMTLQILKYLGKGKFKLTGQHESIIILKEDGEVHDIPTIDYGMYAGLEQDVNSFLDIMEFELKKNDILILYTDGLTEAMNAQDEEFGKDRIIESALSVRKKSADLIKSTIIKKCLEHMNEEKLHDDMSLMIIKKVN